MKPTPSLFLRTKKTILALLLLVFVLPSLSSWPDHDIVWASAGYQGAAPPPPLSNDDFDHAVVINDLPFNDAADTRSATAAPDDPTFCTNNGSVWYTFTPTADTVVEASTLGSDYDIALSVYTGVRGGLTPIPEGCVYGTQSRLIFNATAGTTYYFLVGFCCGFGLNGGGALVFSVQEVPPPANDNFDQATVAALLPFADSVEIAGATLEIGEPTLSCVGANDFRHTVWYAFTATANGSLSAGAIGPFPTALAIYTGGSLDSLTEVRCTVDLNLATFQATAGVTYYFQTGNLFGGTGALLFNLDVTPPPIASFSFNPFDPSVLDTVQFLNNSYDPGNVGLQSENWRLGDGATATGCCPTHRYAADGDYTVQLDVMTFDGRTASTTQNLSVRTHDVAITKFTRPQTARVGQTVRLIVGINNQHYPETVRVDFYKSDPNSSDGFRHIGSLEQFVPVQAKSKTTDFLFNYTFTRDDAAVGKVSFKAVATIVNARDTLLADNAFVTLPVTVRGAQTQVSELLNDDSEIIDDVANGTAIPVARPEQAPRNGNLYIPIVINRD